MVNKLKGVARELELVLFNSVGKSYRLFTLYSIHVRHTFKISDVWSVRIFIFFQLHLYVHICPNLDIRSVGTLSVLLDSEKTGIRIFQIWQKWKHTNSNNVCLCYCRWTIRKRPLIQHMNRVFGCRIKCSFIFKTNYNFTFVC